jgi:DNA-binding SARP family transcriptional activator
MELRILGPLDVVADGRAVAPRAGKQRSLLAFLVLHANERISTDRLIDAVWGESPPPTAAAALQNQVAGLRRLFDAERIETVGSSYLLRLAPGELDVDRFETLVRDAGSASAPGRAELLRAALSLWRGRPLVDVEDELFAQSEIARLQEVRLAALEQCFDAELESGLHATLVAELEALVLEHPLRERLRAQLMLALYRSGRQAEALQVYQETRRLLVDELGIDPSQTLQRLHQQILLQDTALDPEPTTAPAAAAPPASPAPPQEPVAAPREVRKSVTAALLSVELPAGRDPEVLRGLDMRAAAAVRRAVERHGGRIQETLGGGALAVFGVPVLHEDDALRAVRAADEARIALAELDAELAFRAGIATGVTIVGAEASGTPLQAARELGRRAGNGEILLAPATQQLVRDAVECEPAGEDALRLVHLDPTAPGLARRLDTPLVDRERELLLLETSFAHAMRSSACHLFTVCGPGGIGKSRLVAELVKTLGDGATVLAGRCLAYGDGITYWPVIEILRGAAGPGSDDPAAARENIAALVPGPDAQAVADQLAGLLGLGAPPGTAEIAWALRRLFEALAATRPLVVVVDDLHHAEPTLLDLLEGLADRSRSVPILLAGLARPELLETRPTWGGGKANATTVSLEPLDLRDSGLLLANLPGGSQLDPRLRARVVETAGGHPLFVEELLTMLAGEGRSVNGADELPLPLSVEALLAERLERLPPGERLMLECGSVEGEIFHVAGLGVLAPELEPEQREASLAGLLRKDLVRPAEPQLTGEAYRFRHALVAEAAYASLPKTRRATLHEAFAAWLEQAVPDRLGELEEVLAYHLERAFRLREELGTLDDSDRTLGRRAGRLLAAAGRRAYERSDDPAATSLLRRATALLPTGDEERLRRLIDLGAALARSGDFPGADEMFAEAAARAAATNQPMIRAHAEFEQGQLKLMRSAEPDDIIGVADRLLNDPAGREDRVAVAKALMLRGTYHYNHLESGRAAEFYDLVLREADQTEDRTARRRAHSGLTQTFLVGPRPVDEALADVNAMLEADDGDFALEGCLLIGAGWLEAMRGRSDEGRRLLALGANRLDDLGLLVIRARWDCFAVEAELAAGDAAAADLIARRALETLEAIGDEGNASMVTFARAEALYRLGRDDEAEVCLARKEVVERPPPLYLARRQRTQAKLLARRGKAAAAEALARETIALLHATDAVVLRADAHMSLCEALLAGARPMEAETAAETAVALYEAKGASALAAVAAARLLETSAAQPGQAATDDI